MRLLCSWELYLRWLLFLTVTHASQAYVQIVLSRV